MNLAKLEVKLSSSSILIKEDLHQVLHLIGLVPILAIAAITMISRGDMTLEKNQEVRHMKIEVLKVITIPQALPQSANNTLTNNPSSNLPDQDRYITNPVYMEVITNHHILLLLSLVS